MEVLSIKNEILEFSADKDQLYAQTELDPSVGGTTLDLCQPDNDDTPTITFYHYISVDSHGRNILNLKSRLSINALIKDVDNDILEIVEFVNGHIEFVINHMKEQLPNIELFKDELELRWTVNNIHPKFVEYLKVVTS